MAKQKREQMDEVKLNAFLDSKLRQTIGFGNAGDEVSAERVKNLEMYLNRPVGDEEEGRSKLQSSDIQDVIESLLPATLAPFISADKVVEFKPVGKEDQEEAEQQSLYANHIFMVDNPGIHIQYTWQKDAFLQKNGFVYADWCEKNRTARKSSRVDYAGLQTLTQDPEIEVLEYAGFDPVGNEIDPEILEQLTQNPDPMALDGLMFEVDYRRTWKEGRVKVQNVAPENVIVSNNAKDEMTAGLIGWQEQVSMSDMREEGYPEDKLDQLADETEKNDMNGERTVREQAQGGNIDNNGNADTSGDDPSSRMVWRTVVWTRVDYDGDGVAELRKIVRGGASTSGGVILLNEEADEPLITSFTPVPMPHQLFGRCPADQTREIQTGKTSMLRMSMDATYHTVYPRPVIAEDGINEDTYNDLLLDIPGAPIRTRDINAISYLRDAADIGAAYQMLEYFDRMREIRTPVTRQDQGVDIDALNDKTAKEATIQANASSLKKELILRLYAESLSRLFRLINRLVIKHQDRPRLLRLYPNREPVEIDPRYWNADMDVSVKVGLGTGTKDQQTQALMLISNAQKELMAAQSPLVDWDKIYNTQSRIVENAGLSSPDLYFNDPNDPEQQAKMQQQQPQQDPAQVEAQQQEEAAKIEEAMQQRYEQGKAEGADMLKKYQIDKDNETKLALKDKEVQAKSADTQKMAEAASKPTTMVQIDGKEEISQIAQTIGASAIRIEQMAEQTQMMNMETVQTLQVIAETMKQTALIQAAPKVGTLPNGKQVTIQSVLPEQQIQ